MTSLIVISGFWWEIGYCLVAIPVRHQGTKADGLTGDRLLDSHSSVCPADRDICNKTAHFGF